MTEDKSMDPVAVSSLIVLGTSIFQTALKYGDPSLAPPTVEALKAHLERFEALAPLPEEYDVGLVQDAMNYIKEKFGL